MAVAASSIVEDLDVIKDVGSSQLARLVDALSDALALLGWLWRGFALLAAGYLAARLIRRSAPRFMLAQALEDEAAYRELCAAGIIRTLPEK